MKRNQQSPIWPYLGILVCLFVLSITAPRAWDRRARKDPVGQSRAAQIKLPEVDDAAMLVRDEPEVPLEQPEAEELTAQNNLEESYSLSEQPAPSEHSPPVDGSAAPPLPQIERTAPQIVAPAPEFTQQIQAPAEAADVVGADQPPASASEPGPEQPQAVEGTASQPEPESTLEPANAGWPLPKVLLSQLDNLAGEPAVAAWSARVAKSIQEFCRSATVNDRKPAAILAELGRLSNSQPSVPSADPPLEAKLARTRYALTRWLDTWDGALGWQRKLTSAQTTPAPRKPNASPLAEVDLLTRQSPAGAAWREYLLLDELRKLASSDDPASAKARQAAARKVLDRLAPHRLSAAQQRFAASPAVTRLQAELRAWTAEGIDASQLLAHLDRFEQTGLASDSRLLVDDLRSLQSSDSAREVGEQLETHYRNANLRFAIAGALLNRLVPQPETMRAPVRDMVVNVPVYGNSTTNTKLSVRLVPDPQRIRVGLEAYGHVASNTVATSGPATFRNRGQSTFVVRKLLVLGPRGLSVWPAIAEAENQRNYLVSLETNYDGVPLVGSLVRNIALAQLDESKNEARFETEQKVAMRARNQLDAEIQPRLIQAAENLQRKQIATLDRLGLDLVPVTLSTTEDRIVARLRLAGQAQLGAHTPRPRAPSDSWFSMQVHETALNNGIDALELNGRTFTLPALFAWIAGKLDRPGVANQEDLPDDVRLTFAAQDAVHLRCEADRIEITFSFAQFVHGSTTWRNFKVHAFYVPQPNRLDPRFARQGSVSLEGRSVRGPQAHLRTIFSKVLSRNREVSLLDESLTSDPRVKDLEMTQFMVEDGWIGLAYSPRRAANNVARDPE